MIGKRNLTAGEAHIFLYWTVCSLSITTKTQNIVLIFYLLHVFNPFYLFQCSHTLQVLVHWGGVVIVTVHSGLLSGWIV